MLTLPGGVFLVVGFFLSSLGICQATVLWIDCKVSAEKSADCSMRVLLYLTSCFSLAAFKILSLTFAILIAIVS